jgi:hypothetical protein
MGMLNEKDRKWLSVNRQHRTYWVSEEEDRFIRNYLEENRRQAEAKVKPKNEKK